MTEEFFAHVARLRADTIQTKIKLFSQIPQVLHCLSGEVNEARLIGLCCLGAHSPKRLFHHRALCGDKELCFSENVRERLGAADVYIVDASGEMPDTDVVRHRIARNLGLFAPYLPPGEERRHSLGAMASTLAVCAPDIVIGWCSPGDRRAEDFVWSAMIAGVPSIAVYFQAGDSGIGCDALWAERAALWTFWVKNGHVVLCADSYETAIGIADSLLLSLRGVNVLNALLLQPEADIARDAAGTLKRYLGLAEGGKTLVAVSPHALDHAMPRLVEAFRGICVKGPVQCFLLGGGRPKRSLPELVGAAGKDRAVSIIEIDLPVDAALAVADVCLISSQECLNGNLALKAQLSNCAPVIVPSMDGRAGSAAPDAAGPDSLARIMRRLLKDFGVRAGSFDLPPHAFAVTQEVRRDWYVSAWIRMLYGMHERMVLQLSPYTHDMFSQIKYAMKAARLRDLLFGGYAYLAESGLKRLTEDSEESRHERMAACWHLVVWYHLQRESHKAYGMLGPCRQQSIHPPQLLVQAEVFILMLMQKYEHAVDVLERSFVVYGALPALRILHATAVRLKLLQAGEDAALADKEQLKLLGEAYRAMNLAPLELRYVGKPLTLDNIWAPSAPAETDCPDKVSVIFPLRNMENSIAYAIRSMQEQTWRNIEIIVVDDAGTDGSARIVEGMAKDDERIKLIRLADNQGTYTALNIGLKSAAGAFISIHGADDWSHPQKLAKQLACLIGSPDAVAVESRGCRVDMRVNICSPWRLAGPFNAVDSSQLFKRDALLSLGGWDAARFSADTELKRRARVKFGDSAVVTMPDDSVFLLALKGTLTEAKKTGVRSWLPVIGVRRMYANAYGVWHREAKRNNLSLRIADKAFDAPLANRRERNDIARFDVVVLDDFASDAAYTGKGFSLAGKLRARGLAVALLHWRSPFVAPVREIARTVYEQSYSQGICILSSADTIITDAFFIAHHGLLAAMPDDFPAINIVSITLMKH